jgi:hypothetical protein
MNGRASDAGSGGCESGGTQRAVAGDVLPSAPAHHPGTMTLLAYHCFTAETDLIEESEIRSLLGGYSTSFRVAVDSDALLVDLVNAKVLAIYWFA